MFFILYSILGSFYSFKFLFTLLKTIHLCCALMEEQKTDEILLVLEEEEVQRRLSRKREIEKHYQLSALTCWGRMLSFPGIAIDRGANFVCHIRELHWLSSVRRIFRHK